MDLGAAFDELQAAVNADPDVVREARRRRDAFIDALQTKDDVGEAIPSGSLARGSEIEPINDVDVIAIFDRPHHEDWGDPGSSAKAALELTQDYVWELLNENDGTAGQEVRLTRVGNHAVKCFLDDPNDPEAFTVDVTPALRVSDYFVIPERDSGTWISTDPKGLIRLVAERHREQGFFVPLVRDLKRWNRDQNVGLKGLTIEILALGNLGGKDRPDALSKFFSSVALLIEGPVADPTGHSVDVDPKLDRTTARKKFDEAAETSWNAVQAQGKGETDRAACFWREVFGDIFPEPEGGCDKKRSALVAPALITTRPRPIRDAPQGSG